MASGPRLACLTGPRPAVLSTRASSASPTPTTTAATPRSSTTSRRRTNCPPTSVAAIGHQDQANQEYDLDDFWAAAKDGNLPAVSFLKAGGYQQGGGGDSDPLDEQEFIVGLVNTLERLPTWRRTAVVIMYDDSDGAYDHVMPPIVNDSQTVDDALTGPGLCGTKVPILAGYQGRCGYGPRLPLLIISPLGQGQPCRQYAHRPDFGDPLCRGQLARRRADRGRLLRRPVRTAHRHVRLCEPHAGAQAIPQSQHRRTGCATPTLRQDAIDAARLAPRAGAL